MTTLPQKRLQFDEREANAIVTLLPNKGRGKPRSLLDRTISVQYTDSAKPTSTKIDVTLRNDDRALLYDSTVFQEGNILQLTHGYPGMMVDAGQFVIKEPSGDSKTMKLSANERKRSRMARRKVSRVWDNRTRSSVVREVLLQEGFPPGQIHIDETKTKLQSITQTNEHNWQFIYRQAQLQSFEFYVDGKGVHWETPKRNKKPVRMLRNVQNPIGIGEIKDFNFKGIKRGVPGRVTLKGMDPLTKKAFSVTSTASSADRYYSLVDDAGIDDPDEGDRLAGGNTGHELTRNTGARTAKEAKQIADAILKAAKYGAMKMTLECMGDPLIRSRSIVLVWGLGIALDGLWWVEQAAHNHSGGYNTSVEVTREGLAKKGVSRGGISPGEPGINDPGWELTGFYKSVHIW